MLESCCLSGLSLATVIVLAHFLTPAEVGVAAVALGVVQLAGLVVEQFFHDAIVQRKSIESLHIDTASSICLCLGLILWLLCWLGAEGLADLFREPSLAPVVVVAGSSLVFSGISAVPVALMRREMQFRALAVRSLAGRVAGSVVGIALAVSGFGVWSLIAQHVLSTALAACTVWLVATRRPAVRFSFRHLRELAGFAVPSLLTTLVWSSTFRLFTIIAGFFLGTTALGYLNLAFRLVDSVRDVLSAAALQLALPLFSERKEDRQALNRIFHAAAEFAALVTLPIFAGFAVCAAEIVALSVGGTWLPAVPLAQFLALLAMLHFSRLFSATILSALGYPRINLLVGTISLLVCLGGLILVGKMGVLAVALAWAARLVVVLPISVGSVRRATGMGVAEQFEDVAVPLIASALMAVLVYVVKQILPPELGHAAILAILMPLGAIFYVAAMFIIRPRSIPNLLRFLSAGLRRRTMSRLSEAG